MTTAEDLDRRLQLVLAYHERTKHHPGRYAASLGYLDWSTQPDPFRAFRGAESHNLDLPELRAAPSFDSLFTLPPKALAVDRASVSRLLYHSLALSAWKRVGTGAPWSLRINPSSGALHPTEGYLVCGAVPGLTDDPGVFHYAPSAHQLECRREFSAEAWRELTATLPRDALLLGLTSIYWRESWKYGERAFRYCHHDVGHALGAIAFAARTLGWATVAVSAADDEIDLLLGTHRQYGIEAEHADCLVVVFPAIAAEVPPPTIRLSSRLRIELERVEPRGTPNRLSLDHHAWPVIDEVASATRSQPAPPDPPVPEPPPANFPAAPPPRPLDGRQHPAEQIIRQRRSAVAMDGRTTIPDQVLFQMLERTMPGHFPFRCLLPGVHVSLVLFVHRVAGLPEGCYLLVRCPQHAASLRRELRRDFLWQRPAACPRALPLYLLAAGDVRREAQWISCHQDIAADGAFAAGMLAQFDGWLREAGPQAYPRLFWETGLVGQVLYLEAEAAGVRGTGIGCFFDDAMHEFLGLRGRSWQSLYHFTVGGAVEDPRLTTLPPYGPDTLSRQ